MEQHPDLWLIEADTTFRGMYVGGLQEKDLGNREFLARHVKGHGALGDLLVRKKADIEMGDTPSVLYLLRGDPEDPTGESWGGSFVRPDPQRTYWTDNPDPALREAAFPGARTVNRWRPQYLRDWQQRMAGGGIYVGWRFLDSDPPDTALRFRDQAAQRQRGSLASVLETEPGDLQARGPAHHGRRVKGFRITTTIVGINWASPISMARPRA